MKQKDQDWQSEQPEAAAPKLRKRFRLEKLEERIAPKKGGGGTNLGTKNCDSYNHCTLTCS